MKLLPIVKLHDNTFAVAKIVKPNLFSFFSAYLKWEYSGKRKRERMENVGEKETGACKVAE